MVQFGDFAPLCRHTPSYPWCNLFYRQLQRASPETLAAAGASANSESAPVGINPVCGIPRLNHDGSLGNIAQIVASGVSVFIIIALIFFTSRRKAAVGRTELRLFFILYLLSLPLQLLTTGSLLQQGSTALVVLTAIHAGVVAALFWGLLGNAIVATQVVEDGTPSSIIPFSFLTLAFFAGTLYISLDVALGITNTLGDPSSNPADLRSIALFVMTSIWPGAAALIYFLLMAYIVLGVLREVRPMWYYALAAILFVLSQLAWFLLGRVVCSGSDQKVDGSFIATILETASAVVLFFAWRSITEESWEEDHQYYPS